MRKLTTSRDKRTSSRERRTGLTREELKNKGASCYVPVFEIRNKIWNITSFLIKL